ncbi:sulfite reductase flavoprotein alpha-component [Metarhizium album ARSEF 1941]|uniref:NADPH-dependent diflavin oxidoreductase 1 n=1 Tax=Metarhizium album (strain ARSEF 1941) TaxID=1081103 RepID=A0A0B2WX47_METAS|nr:sulfite reductase flavoprotein alpha-component [Metarhizium album ARSEF 1941]KHN98007.1 sulfite reductase flavoprotein alpha-component [Metarhizium album ARSEF 1941]
MTSPGRTALVLYGSETGNAQDMAGELDKLCQRLHFTSRVEELDNVNLNELLQQEFVLFVISTTGQGDMPHNSLLFWKKLLRKKLPPGCLSQMKYSCVGLGDSTYLKFNWAARKLIRRLDQLGASAFFEPCEADEQFPEGIDGSFLRWADDLWKHLLKHYPDPQGRDAVPEDEMLPPKWSLAPAINQYARVTRKPHINGGTTKLPSTPPLNQLPFPNGLQATLVEKKRLTPDTHWQDVCLVSLDMPSSLQVNPGDCLTIYPKNFPKDVQKVINLMEWGAIADEPLDLSLCTLPPTLYTPSSCTLRDILLHNIDINAVPRRSFLKNLSYFSDNEDHRARLLEFTMTEFLDDYFDYATRPRRTIIEVLEEFYSVRVPASHLLDVFPLIRGRDFSIANGGKHLTPASPSPVTRIELLVALVKYRTILRKPREGLCSRYITHVPLSTHLTVTLKPVLSPIHGALNAQRPLIAMATGTGVAPVRSLIHERITHQSSASTILFFGSRNKDADYFFADEWSALPRDKLTVFTAFSRDQREKVYVQDLVRKEAKLLEKLILQRAIFVVCGGSTKMADACKHAVFDPFVEGGDDKERRRILNDGITWWQEIW